MGVRGWVEAARGAGEARGGCEKGCGKRLGGGSAGLPSEGGGGGEGGREQGGGWMEKGGACLCEVADVSGKVADDEGLRLAVLAVRGRGHTTQRGDGGGIITCDSRYWRKPAPLGSR